VNHLKILTENIIRSRYLLLLWVKREIRARYAGTVAGTLWATLLPICTIALYFIFFSLVLKIKIPEVAGSSGYFFYLLAGLVPWMSISEGLGRSASCLVDYGFLIQKMVFPMDIIPVTVVIVSLVPQIVGFSIYFIMLFASHIMVLDRVVWVPLIFFCQVLLMLGMAYLLSALGAVFRDSIQAVGILLQFWFYLTPILYPLKMVPAYFRPLILWSNPLTPIVMGYQWAFLGIPMPQWMPAVMVAWTMLFLVTGPAFFLFVAPTLADQV